ncbi:cyclic nucleotide-binding domain-containing protein [Herpetosiphon gulosus]|uniref:Cyclic nucleotide-binding domain-containing protein n=1 Tax=Herpetosiphon gulosus TaxID=1973496 RepID=A0ABP9X8H8_9CHLR
MNSSVIAVLRRVDIFAGLSDLELSQIAQLCKVAKAKKGQIIFREDSDGDDLYVVHDGAVEIQVQTRGSDGQQRLSTINTAYEGQAFGEIAMLGGGSRSATAVASMNPTTLLVINGPELSTLCDTNTAIGYRIMRNFINDMIYKLRSASLLLRGHIKWQDNQLSQID